MPSSFDRQITMLQNDLLEFATGAIDVVRSARTLLVTDGIVDPNQLATDPGWENRDVTLEESCLGLLALHQPVARDLRRLASFLKINQEIERIHELALGIVERVSRWRLSSQCRPIPAKLRDLAEATPDRVAAAVEAFRTHDLALAYQVRVEDDVVDTLNREVLENLTRDLQADPETACDNLLLFSASRDLERIGDHATNIAEDVIYMIQGTIIRHQRTPERVSA
jgi:phosphate transport system protein